MIYCEIGYGNKSIISSEIEDNGLEYRVDKLIINKIVSLYIRLWIDYRVVIIDSQEGIKRINKDRRCFKLLIGIKSEGE